MSESTTNTTYNPGRVFSDGETLHDDDLNQLIAGINGSVTNIVLGEDNLTLTITKNDGKVITVTLPSGGSDDLTDYVKKTDWATANDPGVILIPKTSTNKGIARGNTSPMIEILPTTTDLIDKRKGLNPVVPSNIDYAVRAALTDPKILWGDEQKTAARETIGLVGGSSYKKKIYATDGEGNLILLGYTNGTGGSDVVQRNPDGSIQVPTPAEGKELGAIHAVNWTVLQNYVNSKIGDISTMLNSILDLQEATE